MKAVAAILLHDGLRHDRPRELCVHGQHVRRHLHALILSPAMAGAAAPGHRTARGDRQSLGEETQQPPASDPRRMNDLPAVPRRLRRPRPFERCQNETTSSRRAGRDGWQVHRRPGQRPAPSNRREQVEPSIHRQRGKRGGGFRQFHISSFTELGWLQVDGRPSARLPAVTPQSCPCDRSAANAHVAPAFDRHQPVALNMQCGGSRPPASKRGSATRTRATRPASRRNLPAAERSAPAAQGNPVQR